MLEHLDPPWEEQLLTSDRCYKSLLTQDDRVDGNTSDFRMLGRTIVAVATGRLRV